VLTTAAAAGTVAPEAGTVASDTAGSSAELTGLAGFFFIEKCVRKSRDAAAVHSELGLIRLRRFESEKNNPSTLVKDSLCSNGVS
jgi:hypothetical protein